MSGVGVSRLSMASCPGEYTGEQGSYCGDCGRVSVLGTGCRIVTTCTGASVDFVLSTVLARAFGGKVAESSCCMRARILLERRGAVAV